MGTGNYFEWTRGAVPNPPLSYKLESSLQTNPYISLVFVWFSPQGKWKIKEGNKDKQS